MMKDHETSDIPHVYFSHSQYTSCAEKNKKTKTVYVLAVCVGGSSHFSCSIHVHGENHLAIYLKYAIQ